MASERHNYELPWPPGVNKYYRNVNGRMLLSKAARIYKSDVQAVVLSAGKPALISGRVGMSIELHAPRAMKYDVDGKLKAILDSLEGLVYENDSQVDVLTVSRGEKRVPGMAVVTIREI